MLYFFGIVEDNGSFSYYCCVTTHPKLSGIKPPPICVHGFYVSGIHKGDHHGGFPLLLAVWASAREIRSLVMTSQVGARSIKGLFSHMSAVRARSTQKLGPLARAPTLSLSTWHDFPPSLSFLSIVRLLTQQLKALSARKCSGQQGGCCITFYDLNPRNQCHFCCVLLVSGVSH